MRNLTLLFATLAAAACSLPERDIPQLEAQAYADTIAAFQARRAMLIAGPEGWATHLGLWWLEPGRNPIGSDPSFRVRLPANRSPRSLGEVIVSGDTATFVAA